MEYYKYKYKNKKELNLIRENFKIKSKYLNEVIFILHENKIRKIKIGNLNRIKEYIKLKGIILESKKYNNVSDTLEELLSWELAKGIDKEIIKHIAKINK